MLVDTKLPETRLDSTVTRSLTRADADGMTLRNQRIHEMNVELPGHATRFDSIEPATFFVAMRRNERQFGFSLQVPNLKAAVVALGKNASRFGYLCSYCPNGIDDAVVLALPRAVIRVIFQASKTFDGSHISGSIVSAGEKAFIAASADRGVQLFDLADGIIQAPRESGLVVYPNGRRG
jgi:hypothetical protein